MRFYIDLYLDFEVMTFNGISYRLIVCKILNIELIEGQKRATAVDLGEGYNLHDEGF